MWKRIKFYTISVLILGLALTAGYYRYAVLRTGGIHRVVDSPAIVQQIQRLNELVTVKYSIQKVIGLKEEKVPFGSESVLLMVQATALAGVDLAGLTTADVRVGTDQSLTIKLPPPKVLHVFINDQETRVWDRTKTWWTPWVAADPELEQKARLAALETMQAAAIEMGILTNAQQNAETILRQFLQVTGHHAVTFAPAPAQP